jgi:hypothetical protein
VSIDGLTCNGDGLESLIDKRLEQRLDLKRGVNRISGTRMCHTKLEDIFGGQTHARATQCDSRTGQLF